MPYRYAVLWEHEETRSLPAAIVIQRDGYVFVDAPDELCVPTEYREPIVVGSIAGPFGVTYRPSDPQYFDQVLIDLSRMFSVGKQGTVSSASDSVVLELLRVEVWEPRRGMITMPYVTERRNAQYATVKAYRKTYYASAPATQSRESTDGEEQGSLVAA